MGLFKPRRPKLDTGEYMIYLTDHDTIWIDSKGPIAYNVGDLKVNLKTMSVEDLMTYLLHVVRECKYKTRFIISVILFYYPDESEKEITDRVNYLYNDVVDIKDANGDIRTVTRDEYNNMSNSELSECEVSMRKAYENSTDEFKVDEKMFRSWLIKFVEDNVPPSLLNKYDGDREVKLYKFLSNKYTGKDVQ